VGYEEGGQLTNRLKANPFCVLLFDEIEKAHPSILDKFLQILEDGRMTDGRGQTVYFSESILIFTSNAGIYRLDPVTGRPQIDPVTGRPIPTIDPTDDLDYETVRTRVLEGVQSYFKHYLGRPELLNRIGQNIVVFDFIRPSVMRSILESKVLPSIRNQVRELWKVQVDFAPAVVDLLMAEAMQDVGSGARGVGNLCEAAVVNPLARHLFRLKVEQGGLEGRRVAVAGVIPSRDGTGPRYELHLEGAPPPV
jgi:ATP-dependent Clp protease ATP-binding subunit ClpB